jgi:hypothetical protein
MKLAKPLIVTCLCALCGCSPNDPVTKNSDGPALGQMGRPEAIERAELAKVRTAIEKKGTADDVDILTANCRLKICRRAVHSTTLFRVCQVMKT